MDTELVSVIIVNWNGLRWLAGCLDSLLQQTYSSLELVFVDNGSTDASVEYVRTKFPTAIVILNGKNLGFGAASNIGAAHSNGTILIFLNNDTILFPTTIEDLVKYKKDTSLNILSADVMDSQHRSLPQGIYSSGIDVLGTPKGWSKKLFYIDGCALMISKNDFDTLSGFDKKYFMYGEDVDLSWRARLLGMKLGICNNAKIVHYGGGSSESTRHEEKTVHQVPVLRRYEAEKNHLRNMLKNYRFLNIAWILPCYMFQGLCEVLLYVATGNFKMVRVLGRAIGWNIENITDTLHERRRIQKNRVVGDWSIMQNMNWRIHKVLIFFEMGIPKFK